jgi:hypothetical protein
MSFFENRDKYLQLLLAFSDQSLAATDFVDGWFRLRYADLKEEDNLCKKWERRFDIELETEVFQGKISKEEFSKRWCELWGLTDEISSLCNILSRVFTTCDCFWPDISDDEVNPPLVLNEKLFREEILELLRELQQWFANTSPKDTCAPETSGAEPPTESK